MAIMAKFHTIVGNKSANDNTDLSADDPNNASQVSAGGDEKGVNAPVKEGPSDEEAKPTEDAQNGVRKIEAVTLTWGKGSVYLMLVL